MKSIAALFNKLAKKIYALINWYKIVPNVLGTKI